MSADQNEITNVPTTSGTTPNFASRNSGAQVVPKKKSVGPTSRKKSIDGTTSETTMPTVVRTEIAAATKRTTWTACSPQRIFLRGSVVAADRATVASAVVIYEVAPSS